MDQILVLRFFERGEKSSKRIHKRCSQTSQLLGNYRQSKYWYSHRKATKIYAPYGARYVNQTLQEHPKYGIPWCESSVQSEQNFLCTIFWNDQTTLMSNFIELHNTILVVTVVILQTRLCTRWPGSDSRRESKKSK